ncbi:hypothetical protein B5K11_32140 [Rhizobium leguminosarum bv. trifolii]|uniref:hypothetical protein n=1 Tax=Rhizobium leguminosarum TaxID=384 RepID=UPI000E2FAB9A|nr:hypothetical protein [Rhizobium leguminosarum]RFB84792.1 hypothetical protein B5K11_32140 [Rhizobium leguminosarum bv. trifolii]
MQSYLDARKVSLAWISFDSRLLFDGNGFRGSANLHRVWEWKNGKIKMIREFFSSTLSDDDDVEQTI